jgi:hypothetical protein
MLFGKQMKANPPQNDFINLYYTFFHGNPSTEIYNISSFCSFPNPVLSEAEGSVWERAYGAPPMMKITH